MKQNKTLFIILFALLLALFGVQAQTQLYVSPSGDDSATGSITSPLKTLMGARDKVRSISTSTGLPEGGIVINFRGGTYPLNETVFMEGQDSGEDGKPIVYKGYQDEDVIFDGNLFVDQKAFQPTTSAQAALLHDDAVGHVYSQVISDSDILSVLQSDDSQMSMNSKMLTVARYPNNGFAHVDQSTISGESVGSVGTFESPTGASFELQETYANAKWEAEIARTQRVTAKGYMSAQWLKESKLVASESNGTLRFKNGTSYGLSFLVHEKRPNRMFFTQMLCELDEAGEWYFDKEDNTLYIYPLETLDENSQIGVWAGTMMVRAKEMEHVHFVNMTIQNIGVGGNDHAVFDLVSGSDYLIAGITFRNIAQPISSFNCGNSVRNTTILSCDFIDTYTSRLYGGEFSSKGDITNGNNKLENCHFTRVYGKGLEGKATHVRGVGNICKNNLIHNYLTDPLGHTGIDHSIVYNEVFNTNVEEGDDGAISCGQDAWSHGVVVKYNFIHHNLDVPGLYGRAGIMRDDYDGGDHMEGNVIYKGGGDAGIKMNGGSGHTILSNVIMECGYGIQQFDGGNKTYELAMGYITGSNGKTATSGDKENYLGGMLQKYGVSDWTVGLTESNWYSRIEPFWLERYPNFDRAMKAYSDNNEMNAYECRFYDNLFSGNVKDDIKQPNSADISGNQTITSAIFEDPENMNFKFKTPLPSYAADIPFEKIGLFVDEYRRSVPEKDTYRRAVKDRFANTPAHSSSSAYNASTVNDRLYYNSGLDVLASFPSEESTIPFVGFDYPFNGQCYIPGDTIKVKAYISGNVAKVSLFCNDALVREITSGDYEWGFSDLLADSLLRDTAEGRYFLDLVIEDNVGNTSTRGIAVKIQQPELIIPSVNVALNKPVSQSSIHYSDGSGLPENGVDGNTNGDFWGGLSVTSTGYDKNAWWELDLEDHYNIKDINVWNRIGSTDRLVNFHVFVSTVPFLSYDLDATIAQEGVTDFFITEEAKRPSTIDINTEGRYVRLQLSGDNYLHFAEFEVNVLPEDTVPSAAPSVAPYANAGNDTIAVEGTTIVLDASASYHPLGDSITSYKWTAPSGIVLTNMDSIHCSFSAPILEEKTEYDVVLTAYCNDKSHSDTLIVEVINRPVADAGPDQTVSEGDDVFLDGYTGSIHPDGEMITDFEWILPEGITVDDQFYSDPLFTAPEVLNDTTLIFSLIVYSKGVASYPDTVLVHVQTPSSIHSNIGNDVEFDVYPIPVEGKSVIIEANQVVSEFEFELFDIYGRMLCSEKVFSNRKVIDASLFSVQGVYLMNIVYCDANKTIKIVVE